MGRLIQLQPKNFASQLYCTGHYARIIRTEDDVQLARAADPSKDQSYVLWGLTREQLKGTLLPLGDYKKDDIRFIADEHKLASAHRPDSQDLCFIPQGTTTQEYLANFIPAIPGPIIHSLTGQVLGQHKGTHNFTIGQRKGMGIASAEPLYVTHIDPDTKVVYAGPKSALLRRDLKAHSANWIIPEIPKQPFSARAKIRYNSPALPALVTPLADNKIHVEFEESQSAITPGQVLAFTIHLILCY